MNKSLTIYASDSWRCFHKEMYIGFIEKIHCRGYLDMRSPLRKASIFIPNGAYQIRPYPYQRTDSLGSIVVSRL